jgi:hypothetical protein
MYNYYFRSGIFLSIVVNVTTKTGKGSSSKCISTGDSEISLEKKKTVIGDNEKKL